MEADEGLAVPVPPLRSMTMEKYQKVIAFFKELGFRFDISSFDDRLVAQKLVCLLELKGVDLGYSCSLYVRGPYSPDLTQDLYAFPNEFATMDTGSRLTSEEKENRGRPWPDLRISSRFRSKSGQRTGYYTLRQGSDSARSRSGR